MRLRLMQTDAHGIRRENAQGILPVSVVVPMHSRIVSSFLNCG